MTKHNLSLTDRFLSHVSIPENINDCWEWMGANHGDGYGCFGINYKLYGAHRVSFELFVGPIPDGLFVCHSCDNRACVNPSHLFLGTHQDNMQDRNDKNRQQRGERCGTHKLTEQEIFQIREMLEQGYTQQEIARMFGTSRVNISYIKTGKSWGWLK